VRISTIIRGSSLGFGIPTLARHAGYDKASSRQALPLWRFDQAGGHISLLQGLPDGIAVPETSRRDIVAALYSFAQIDRYFERR
jgi:hypothetical protein